MRLALSLTGTTTEVKHQLAAAVAGQVKGLNLPEEAVHTMNQLGGALQEYLDMLPDNDVVAVKAEVEVRHTAPAQLLSKQAPEA